METANSVSLFHQSGTALCSRKCSMRYAMVDCWVCTALRRQRHSIILVSTRLGAGLIWSQWIFNMRRPENIPTKVYLFRNIWFGPYIIIAHSEVAVFNRNELPQLRYVLRLWKIISGSLLKLLAREGSAWCRWLLLRISLQRWRVRLAQALNRPLKLLRELGQLARGYFPSVSLGTHLNMRQNNMTSQKHVLRHRQQPVEQLMGRG